MSQGAAHNDGNDGPEPLGEASRSPIFAYDGRRLDGEVDPASIKSYNFRNPGYLRQGNLRLLELMHQKFIDHLSARLSTFLRMECVVKLVQFGSATFSDFAGTIAGSTHLSLFQVESLTGIGILDISLPLSLVIADRMLGGKGNLGDTERGLTEIEAALVEDAAQLILTEWTRHWPEQAAPCAPVIVGHDSSARFLRTSEDEAVHVTIETELSIGQCSGRMQIGVPLEMIEPVVKLMEAAQIQTSERKARSREWRAQYNNIHVPVIAEWVVKQMAVSDVIKLQPGDVLEMSRDLIGQTQVRLSNATEFIGTAGVEDGRVAIQLTHRKNSE